MLKSHFVTCRNLHICRIYAIMIQKPINYMRLLIGRTLQKIWISYGFVKYILTMFEKFISFAN